MKKERIVESEGNTYFIKGRGIPKGCTYCLKGTKAVLFLNGICQKPPHCAWYCPISEERKGEDNTFADEIKIKTKDGLIEEIDKIKAKGMSITGGDPLFKPNLEKTIDYIKYVKSVKGKKFHIHLYTNGIDFTEEIANRLASAGLDEIRFHPPKECWDNIRFAFNKGISVGAEVPVIPENDYIEYLKELIFYLDNIGAEFINLNEFEYCFPNSESLKERDLHLKEGTIASVKNSKEMALDLLEELSNKVSLKLHFCSIRAKDHYQLKNRYLRRAKTIKLPYEEITDEGLLLFAQLEGPIELLKKTHQFLIDDLKIPQKLIHLDNKLIKIPYYIALEEQIISYLDSHNLKGFVLEIIPFRGEYCQITEKTPLQMFKNEMAL